MIDDNYDIDIEMALGPIRSIEDWGYVAFHRGIPLDTIDDPEARAGWIEAQGRDAYLRCVLEARRDGEAIGWDELPF